MRATINPETGGVDVSVVPYHTTLDAPTLEALRRDTEDLKQTYHPDGSVSVHLQGRFQNVSVARIDENGKLLICSEDANQIDGIIDGRSAARPAARQTPEAK